jgi:hypothetical protein
MKLSVLNGILAAVLIMTLACGGGCGGIGSKHDGNVRKVQNWQEREALCSQGDEILNGVFEHAAVMKALINVLDYPSIPYVSDGDEDYWQTSQETAERGCGDCEDIAFYWYAKIREAGTIADINVSLYWVRNISGAGHMVVKVQTAGDPIFINNGNIKTYLKYEHVIMEFDLWSHWS